MKRLAVLLAAYRERREAAKTRKALRELSDHLLRDLGLRREQIELIGRRDLPQSFFRR